MARHGRGFGVDDHIPGGFAFAEENNLNSQIVPGCALVFVAQDTTMRKLNTPVPSRVRTWKGQKRTHHISVPATQGVPYQMGCCVLVLEYKYRFILTVQIPLLLSYRRRGLIYVHARPAAISHLLDG